MNSGSIPELILESVDYAPEVADPEGVQGVRTNYELPPRPPPSFKYPMKYPMKMK